MALPGGVAPLIISSQNIKAFSYGVFDKKSWSLTSFFVLIAYQDHDLIILAWPSPSLDNLLRLDLATQPTAETEGSSSTQEGQGAWDRQWGWG